MSFLLIVQTSVSFSVFGFLLPVSYAVLLLTIMNFFIMLAIYLREPRMSYFGLAVTLYYFLLITFTFINGTDLQNAVFRAMEVWLLLLLFNYYKHQSGLLLKTIAAAYSVCIYVNLAVMIIFPNWMFAAENAYDSFLLGGNYNSMGCRFLCGIITSMLCINYSRKWLVNTIVISIVSIVTLTIVGSMTSLSSIILFLALSLIPFVKVQKAVLVGFFVSYVLFQVFVVFSGESLHQNELAVYFIEDVLGKDMTFTNRTGMWDAAGRMVAQSPVFGYGLVDKEWYLTRMSTFAIGPHNYIYAVLIYGGVTLLACFIALLVAATRRIFSFLDRSALTLLLGTTTLLFMMLMEVYPDFFLMLLLTLIFFYPELNESWTREKGSKAECDGTIPEISESRVAETKSDIENTKSDIEETKSHIN